jgi:hypothetical protein
MPVRAWYVRTCYSFTQGPMQVLVCVEMHPSVVPAFPGLAERVDIDVLETQ